MSLSPYARPLTADDARHLVRRLGFGAPAARVVPLIGLTATDAVRLLLNEAAEAPALGDPEWMRQQAPNELMPDVLAGVHRRMLAHPVREKLTLFWTNHLVATMTGVGNVRQMWRHYNLLRDGAFGSFRGLVEQVGKTPAMLRFLNGDQSFGGAPNQNYARELLELFTLGPVGPDGAPNYTEADIVEAARALTGWMIRNELTAYHNPANWDGGAKTFLGQTGPWGHDDVVRIVFEQRGRAVAHFLARKLLAFFVTHTPRPEDEAALADVILAHDFELRPVYDALFASALFFEPTFRGALVKGPLELMVGLMATLGVNPDGFNAHYLENALNGARQLPFYQPDVAGWRGFNPPSANGRPGYLAWYATESYGPVWGNLGAIASDYEGWFARDDASVTALAADPDDPFLVAQAVAETLLPVAFDWASLPTVAAPLAGDALVALPATARNAAPGVLDLAKILLGPVPFYEWARLPANMKAGRVRAYVVFLVTQVPEFFLN